MDNPPPSGERIDAAYSQGFIYKPTGPVWQTFIVDRSQVIPLAAQPPGPPQLFVGRQAELRQLQGWLMTVTPDFLRNAEHPEGRMGLIYGPEGVGKSTLIRRWLANLRDSKTPPIIAHIGFDLQLLVGKHGAQAGWTQAIYELHWQTLAASGSAGAEGEQTVTRHFPTAFRLGSCPWVALGAQLTLQSHQVQQALTRGEEWTVELRFDSPLPPDEALTALLAAAATERRPIILACEGLQHASADWLTLLQSWEKTIRTKQWPVLLLLEYDYPHPLHEAPSAAQSDERLTWLRQRCGAPAFLAELLHLGPLTRYEIAEILLPASQQYAADLFLMSEGLPNLLRELLTWWRTQGVAQEELAGYWTIKHLPAHTYRFTELDLAHTIDQALTRSAELAVDLGYQGINATTLRAWLNHAVWEGDAFHDQALALAVGWQDDTLNDFLTIVDEALCQTEQHPQGLLAEIAESIALPYGDNQTRHLTRYRFVQPLVAVLLRQRQSPQERLRYGQAYAQALAAVYAPHHERMLETLATIYQSLGLAHLAAQYRQRWNAILYLAQEEAALTEELPLAKCESEQRSLVRRILRFFGDAYHRRHPGQLLPWLQAALAFSRHLCDQWNEATTLTNIGLVYSALGDKQEALRYFNQALPLLQQVGDRGGEASTLTNIGLVYDDLGEKQEALRYYTQALPLLQQVGDRGGEASTLTNIGLVYDDLDEKQEALRYYTQALPLRRQVGDRWGESVTRYNMAMVYVNLGRLDEAVAELEQVVAIDEAVGHPDLASDQAKLAQVRAMLAKADNILTSIIK